MKKTVLIFVGFLVSVLLVVSLTNAFSLVESSVKIEGTSNVHDWESKATSVKVSGDLEVSNGELLGIKDLKVYIPVKGIESSKGSIMDGKTWEALKAKSCSNISYKMSKLNYVKKSGSSYIVSTSGNLTIACKTKYVTISAKAKPLGSNKFRFVGSKKLKMTSFGIDPPTAMFGTMTTGDNITIKYNLVLKEN